MSFQLVSWRKFPICFQTLQLRWKAGFRGKQLANRNSALAIYQIRSFFNSKYHLTPLLLQIFSVNLFFLLQENNIFLPFLSIQHVERIYENLCHAFCWGYLHRGFCFLDINPDEDIVLDMNEPFCLLIMLSLASSNRKPYQHYDVCWIYIRLLQQGYAAL